MKYPKDLRPFKSQAEHNAYLYGALGAAWNIIAQYEAEDEQRQHDRMRESLARRKTAKDRADEAREAADNQDDE